MNAGWAQLTRGMAVAMTAAAMTACGGDEGPEGDAGPPAVMISVSSYGPGSFPEEEAVPGSNATALVRVSETASSVPITKGVSAVVNGVALEYLDEMEMLGASLALEPGARIDVEVVIDGVSYHATANHLPAAVELLTPAPGTVWDAGSPNTVTWSSVATGADPDATHQVTLLPVGGGVAVPARLPVFAQSHVVAAGDLAAGSYSLIVALSEQLPLALPGLHPLSMFNVSAHDHRIIQVEAGATP